MNNPQSLSQNRWLALNTAVLGTVTLALTTMPNAQVDNQVVHWSYGESGNPTEWEELSPEFATCELGHSQSPIDINSFEIEPIYEPINTRIKFDYQFVSLEVVNNGHTIQVNYPKASSVKS